MGKVSRIVLNGWQTKHLQYQLDKVKSMIAKLLQRNRFATKRKRCKFSFQLMYIYSGKKKVYQNSNRDSGSLPANLNTE
jgi:hypothetical protein